MRRDTADTVLETLHEAATLINQELNLAFIRNAITVCTQGRAPTEEALQRTTDLVKGLEEINQMLAAHALTLGAKPGYMDDQILEGIKTSMRRCGKLVSSLTRLFAFENIVWHRMRECVIYL